MITKVYTCLICSKEVTYLGSHLRTHGISSKDYYDKYISSPGTCKVCNKPTKWNQNYFGYNEYCSRICLNSKIWSSEKRRKDQSEIGKKTIFHARKRLKECYSDPDWISMKSDIAIRINKDTSNKFGANGGFYTDYKGIRFRSSWEAKFAKELDDHLIDWEYENKSFPIGGGRKYTPDFFIPSINLYIEIKPSKFVDDFVIEKCECIGSPYSIVTEKNWKDKMSYIVNSFKQLTSNECK